MLHIALSIKCCLAYTYNSFLCCRKINSADCVDMDCDALKKVLIKAQDASFFGEIGSVIPQSEYEWDGDRRRGMYF